jgi:hypothetical protein
VSKGLKRKKYISRTLLLGDHAVLACTCSIFFLNWYFQSCHSCISTKDVLCFHYIFSLQSCIEKKFSIKKSDTIETWICTNHTQVSRDDTGKINKSLSPPSPNFKS